MKETSKLHKIYFIGIGGIGMSALARYMNALGKQVYGYDKTETTLTLSLVTEGMNIHYEDNIDLVPKDIDLVVYTPAIPKDHKELNYLMDNGFDVIKRSALLGRLSNEQKTIAIAGTHGKTSTTALTSHLLKYGGVDVSAFVGGIMTNYETNYISGNGEWMVVEADEYDRSFLQLTPDVIALMSMDADHLDIYGDEDNMRAGFESFLLRIKEGGLILLNEKIMDNISDETIMALSEKEVRLVNFGFGTEVEARASNIEVIEGSFVFDYEYEEKIRGIISNLPGRHNIENALVAMTIGAELGLSAESLKEGMKDFKGIKRRFEKIVEDDGRVYIDDYAHHPTELNAAIDAARELYPGKKLTGIFQPHLFSRTRDFAQGFASSLDKLDRAILMDIYPARELPMDGIDSQLILDLMENKNAILVKKEVLMDMLKQEEIEVLLTLGAGDIDVFVEKIKSYLDKEID